MPEINAVLQRNKNQKCRFIDGVQFRTALKIRITHKQGIIKQIFPALGNSAKPAGQVYYPGTVVKSGTGCQERLGSTAC